LATVRVRTRPTRSARPDWPASASRRRRDWLSRARFPARAAPGRPRGPRGALPLHV